MGVLCFQASCLLLIIMSSFLPLPFPPMCVVPGPFSRSSNVLFSSDKNNWFYSALITKILGTPFPAILKFTWKNTFLIQPPCYLLFAFISPRNSLSPSSLCLEILITLLFLNTTFHHFLAQQYPAHLWPSFQCSILKCFHSSLLISSFSHKSLRKKGHSPSIFGLRNIELSLCFQALIHLMHSILVISFSTL